jgi:hypothetical protein
MRLFRTRRDSLTQCVILPLNDPGLAEHAQRLADFAATHRGNGHQLRKVRTRLRGQTIVCRCGVPVIAEAPSTSLLALMEDETIDDDGNR